MADQNPDPILDADLVKQQLTDLRTEIARLNRELGQAEKAAENPWRQLTELRRLVQDSHHRERHLRLRCQELQQDAAKANLQEASQVLPSATKVVGQNGGGQKSVERVDPAIFERIPDNGGRDQYWPTPASVLPALKVHPGWGNYTSLGDIGAVIGMSMLGLDETGRDQLIDLVVRLQMRHREFFPLFITDVDDFAALRVEHFVFEYLPPWPGEATEPSRERWDQFLVDRVALIKRKWGISRFISFADQQIPESWGEIEEVGQDTDLTKLVDNEIG